MSILLFQEAFQTVAEVPNGRKTGDARTALQGMQLPRQCFIIRAIVRRVSPGLYRLFDLLEQFFRFFTKNRSNLGVYRLLPLTGIHILWVAGRSTHRCRFNRRSRFHFHRLGTRHITCVRHSELRFQG